MDFSHLTVSYVNKHNKLKTQLILEDIVLKQFMKSLSLGWTPEPNYIPLPIFLPIPSSRALQTYSVVHMFPLWGEKNEQLRGETRKSSNRWEVRHSVRFHFVSAHPALSPQFILSDGCLVKFH